MISIMRWPGAVAIDAPPPLIVLPDDNQNVIDITPATATDGCDDPVLSLAV